MASLYPGALDNLATNKGDGTATATDHAAHHNDLGDAVNKVEAVLGTDPSGTFSTVKERLQAADLKASVRAASVYNTNVSLTAPGATMDGVTLAAGDRVFLKNQTAPAENGIYVWTGAAAALTRADDADTALKMSAPVLVTVEQGAENEDSIWELVSNNPITLGTTPLYFTRIYPDYPSPAIAISGQPGRMWLPPTYKMANYDAMFAPNGAAGVTTQVIKVQPLGVLRASHSLSQVSFVNSGTAVGTPTNHWAGIARASTRQVLGVSADKLTGAIGAHARIDYTFTSFTATQDEPLLSFIMVKATTIPGFHGFPQSGGLLGAIGGVLYSGNSNTAQTTPIANGTILAAFTANTGACFTMAL